MRKIPLLTVLTLIPGLLAATPAEDVSVVVPAEQMEFYQNKEGLTVANGRGDPSRGAHSNFIKMPGGARSGSHTHSYSYYGVVISGVVANEPGDQTAARALRAGSYWYQKGREPHVTNCLSSEECLIFVTSKGAFDFHPVPPSTTEPVPRVAESED